MNEPAGGNHLRIAVPVAEGALAQHFGHCGQFAFFDADTAEKKVITQTSEVAPPHQPGLLPRWLSERGVNLVIAGGMGSRAQRLFEEQGVEVIVGAPASDPLHLVQQHLAGTLEAGANVCDH